MRPVLAVLAPLMLAACASVPAPEPNNCWNTGRRPLSEILARADWAAEGRIITSWETDLDDGLVVGSAQGRASARLGKTLKGDPPRLWTIFDWALVWQDTAPFQVGEQPRPREAAIVWHEPRNGVDYMPAVCVSGR
jgi:hypothetical protein